MMKNSANYSVFGLLLLSAVSLTSLVPGGQIETRDFSHISPLVLGSFNVFLTMLSLTSFLLLYSVWRRQRWAFVASGIWGIGYFLVYVLDLARWFPVSPDAMTLRYLRLRCSAQFFLSPWRFCHLSMLMLIATRLISINNVNVWVTR